MAISKLLSSSGRTIHKYVSLPGEMCFGFSARYTGWRVSPVSCSTGAGSPSDALTAHQGGPNAKWNSAKITSISSGSLGTTTGSTPSSSSGRLTAKQEFARASSLTCFGMCPRSKLSSTAHQNQLLIARTSAHLSLFVGQISEGFYINAWQQRYWKFPSCHPPCRNCVNTVCDQACAAT